MILAAEVAVTRGDNKNFKAFSDDAFFLTQDNIKFCDDINSSIFDHSQAAFWSGYSSLLESDKDAAGEKFQLYKSLVLKLTNTAPENTLYREELAAAFVNLGAYHVSLSNYKKALLEFSDATEIYAHLIKENPNDEITARNYADTIGWQAKVYSQLGDLEASKENRLLELREADRILTTINPNDWKTQYIKYSSVRALARLEYLQENYAASIKYSKRCEKGFGVLLEHDQSNNKWKKGLALCLTLLSEALYQNKLIGEGDRIKDKLISTIEALPTNLELSEQKLKKELGI